MYVYVCVRMFGVCVYIRTLFCKNTVPDMQKGFFGATCICHKPSLRLRVTTAVHAIPGVANRTCNRITSPHLLAL